MIRSNRTEDVEAEVGAKSKKIDVMRQQEQDHHIVSNTESDKGLKFIGYLWALY